MFIFLTIPLTYKYTRLIGKFNFTSLISARIMCVMREEYFSRYLYRTNACCSSQCAHVICRNMYRIRMLSIRFAPSIYMRERVKERYRERERERERERGWERKADAQQTEKNGNSLKRLSEAAVSLTRRRLVCFSAYVKLNSPGNFTPTVLLHFRRRFPDSKPQGREVRFTRFYIYLK